LYLRNFQSLSWSRINAFLRWECSRELLRGLSYLFSILLYGLLAILILILIQELPVAYVQNLIPGVAVSIVLHPFVQVGDGIRDPESLPRTCFSLPAPTLLFVFRGTLSNLLHMIVGLVLYLSILGLNGIPIGFASRPFFWLVLIFSTPAAVGYGFLTTSVQLLTNTAQTSRRFLEVLLISLGCVLFLPERLYPLVRKLGYLSPHYVPVQVAREMGAQDPMLSLVPIILLGVLLLIPGTLILTRTLRSFVENGYFHRIS